MERATRHAAREEDRNSRRLGLMGVGAVTAALLGGCAQPDRTEFGDATPSSRIDLLHQAAATRDTQYVDELIDALSSDDAAERFLAIRALERTTGQTLGYDHAGSPEDRKEAADRWADWYDAQVKGGKVAGGDRRPPHEATHGP